MYVVLFSEVENEAYLFEDMESVEVVLFWEGLVNSYHLPCLNSYHYSLLSYLKVNWFLSIPILLFLSLLFSPSLFLSLSHPLSLTLSLSLSLTLTHSLSLPLSLPHSTIHILYHLTIVKWSVPLIIICVHFSQWLLLLTTLYHLPIIYYQ